MKRWHIEQILYLNEGKKPKLAFSDLHTGGLHFQQSKEGKRDNIFLVVVRKCVSFFVNIL